MSLLKVGLIQQTCLNDYEKNIEKNLSLIHQAATHGAQLILLQELHTSPYFCQTEHVDLFDYAESIPGPTTERLGKLAKTRDVVLIISLFEKRATGLYHNTAIVIERDGQIAGKYRKMHIPDDPGYYEKFYFTPGDMGFTPVQTSLGKLGVLICWDQWYPEAARLMALAGADILLYPTAIGWSSQEKCAEEKIRQRDAWITIQRAHAIANGLPVLVCNRVGFESSLLTANKTQGITFWGSSFVAGPQGEVLAEASIDRDQILLADIHLHRSETVRRAWPFLRDRRIDAYQGMVERYLG